MRESGYTLGFWRRIAHNGPHAETGAFRTGPLSLPSAHSARSRTSPGRVSERQTLPLLRLDPVCSRRTQRAFGTAMRLCVSLFRRRRGPAGLRDFFRFCRNRDLYIRRSWFSAWARQGRYHYPRCAPRAAETLGGRLSKRLICRFLRSGGRSSPHDSYFLANTQNFLLAVPVANAFALWYDKFSKLEFAKEVEHMKKSLVFAVIFILLFTVGCSQQKNEQPSLTETTSPPEALASQQTIIPEFEDVSWPVVSVRAEDFGMEATLDNPVFAEVFDNTSEMPLDKLIAFDLIADALSEGASDEIYRRFMEAPNAVLTFLSLVGDQTVELTGLGEVSAAEFTCRGIASADVAWYGATPEFDAIIKEYRGYYPTGKIAELLDCMEEEHEAAIQRNASN